MTEEAAATPVELTVHGPLRAPQVAVMRSLQQIGGIVPVGHWCLIGGLMVEILLASRGATMLRPTDDGDIIGDVVADRAVLRKLAHALLDINFTEHATGWSGDIGLRFQEHDSGVFIDVLAPDNTSRLRNVLPTRPRKQSLEAPGTDYAMVTASTYAVTFSTDMEPLIVRVPSVLGAIHAKASAWRALRASDNPSKHLQDSAALLSIANLGELREVPRSVRRRLAWLHEALSDPNSPGWEYVPSAAHSDAATRLALAIG